MMVAFVQQQNNLQVHSDINCDYINEEIDSKVIFNDRRKMINYGRGGGLVVSKVGYGLRNPEFNSRSHQTFLKRAYVSIMCLGSAN